MCRLDEATSADDRQAVYSSLGLIESIVTIVPSTSTTICPKILPFLLGRIKLKTKDSNLTNREYSSEILAILMSGTSENRICFGKLGGVDDILRYDFLCAEYK